MDEANRIAKLTKEIAKLEAALTDTHIDQCLSESYFELACQRLWALTRRNSKKHRDPDYHE